MLLSLLQNNQNVVPAVLPKVVVDRGGGGPQWPGYDIVDIQGALASFVEVAGEHPVARAVRRTQHVRQHLDSLRDVRERREGAAFIAGAVLAESAAQEQLAAKDAEIERLIRVVDALQAKPSGRGAYDPQASGIGGFLLFAGACTALGILITRAAKAKR